MIAPLSRSEAFERGLVAELQEKPMLLLGRQFDRVDAAVGNVLLARRPFDLIEQQDLARRKS